MQLDMLRRTAAVAFTGTTGPTISNAKTSAIKQSHTALSLQGSAFTRAPQPARLFSSVLLYNHLAANTYTLHSQASPTRFNRFTTSRTFIKPAAIEDKNVSRGPNDYEDVLEVYVDLANEVDKKRANNIKA